MSKIVYVSMPCWGKKYIAKFLDFSLPTLLAEGNIPELFARGYDIKFYIYGDTDSGVEYENNKAYDLLKNYCDVKHVNTADILPVGRNISSVELFSLCHEHLLSVAAEYNSLGLFLCCDALLNSSALKFAVSKIEGGFKAVLNSAVRVNYEDCVPFLRERVRGDSVLTLNSQELVQMISKHIHMDEKNLAQPSVWAADGWPGIFSWFREGVGYLKHTFYFNPTLLLCEKGMTLGGATFDSSDMMNHHLSAWDENVYVVSSPDELLILDLADKEINHLPLKKSRMSAMDVALNASVWRMPEWQNKVFEVGCQYPLSNQHKAFPALQKEAEMFVAQVNSWKQIFKRCPEAAADQKWAMLADYYRVNFRFSIDKMKAKIDGLCNKYRGEAIVLYGVGEFCEYIVRQFKFEGCSVYLSDSNPEKLGDSLYGYPCVLPDELTSYAKVALPMSLKFQNEMQDTITKNNGDKIIVEIIDWAAQTD